MTADGAAPHVCTLPATELSRFTAALQQGVRLRVRAGATLQGFLEDELGLDPRYVAERITTVFLDGQVVDRLEDVALRDGSRLALSAAMPGLVGATLRRGGYYAAMRGAITHRAAATAAGEAPALVRVKLFNLLIAELGPVLLGHGVVVSRGEAEALLRGASAGALPQGDAVELRVRLH